MKSNVLKLSSGVALVCASSLCIAATPSLSSSSQPTDNGFYVGIQAGAAKTELPSATKEELKAAEEEGITILNPKRFKLGGRVFGGYLIRGNNHLSYGLELGAMAFQEENLSVTKTTTEISDDVPPVETITTTEAKLGYRNYLFDALAVGKYHLNAQWNVFGKAGIAYVNQKATLSGSETVNDVKTDLKPVKSNLRKFKPEVQAGIGYDVNKNLGINLTYIHVFGQKLENSINHNGEDVDINTNTFPVNALMLGVEYHFA
jgi:outer membrane immunogenic protein